MLNQGFCQLCGYRLQPIIFFLGINFFSDRKSLKMQIFTRQGVYDSKMVNKMKQCLYKKALLYHGSPVDDTVLAFIMS